MAIINKGWFSSARRAWYVLTEEGRFPQASPVAGAGSWCVLLFFHPLDIAISIFSYPFDKKQGALLYSCYVSKNCAVASISASGA